MQKYQDNVLVSYPGVAYPLVGAVVTVINTSGGSSQMYSDNGITPINSVTTDVNGYFSFYAADGRYTITGNGSGGSFTRTDILLEDPANANIQVVTQSIYQNGVAPSTPAAGYVTVYSKTADKLLYYQDEAGVEHNITQGSASQTFSVAPATAAAHAVRLDQLNASTGAIGEKITYTVASGSAVSLTNNTQANIGAGQSITAGKWVARGYVAYLSGSGTTVTRFQHGPNTTSASLPANAAKYPFIGDPNTAGNGAIVLPIVETSFTLGSTTTVYIVANALFATSTLSAYCSIEFERAAL